MTVYIKDTKNGFKSIETNVSKVTTLEDGRIAIEYKNNDSWLGIRTIYKDSIIEKVEA